MLKPALFTAAIVGAVALASTSHAATCSIAEAEFVDGETGSVRLLADEFGNMTLFLEHGEGGYAMPETYTVPISCPAGSCILAGGLELSVSQDGGNWRWEASATAPSALTLDGRRYEAQCPTAEEAGQSCPVTAAEYVGTASTVRLFPSEHRHPLVVELPRRETMGTGAIAYLVQPLNCTAANQCVAAGGDYFFTAEDGGHWWGSPAGEAPSWLSFQGQRYERHCLPN